MCVRTNVHFCMKTMLAYSPKTNFVFVSHGSKNIQLFSVLAVVYANDGWTKLQFAYFDYFPVHRICLSMLFKTHSLVDYECT